jgi:hypothetical protein
MDKSTGSAATAELDESLAVNPLNIDYDRFAESDINDACARANVNCCMRKFSGIRAIATMLNATAVETNAQGKAPLADHILIGLADALTELAVDGGIQIENVGLRFSAIEREKK